MILQDLLRSGSIAGAGVSAGSALLVANLLAPRIAGFSSDLSYRMHDEFLHHDGHNVIAAGPSIFASLCALAVVILDGADGTAGILTVVGIACSASVGVITARVCAPANDEIRRLKANDDRPEYSGVREGWWRGHITRAICALAAFLAYTFAALAA